MYGGNWVVKRASRNHDAALNQMMRELPDPEKDSRMRELRSYLDAGFWHIALNEPPFDAVKKFDGVSLQEYNDRCLSIAQSDFEKLRREI